MDGTPYFQFALKYYLADRLGKNRDRPTPGTVDLWSECEKWRTNNPEGHARAISGSLVGSPETIRKWLRKYSNSHVDQIIALDQRGGGHEHICESLELFATKVMHKFRAAKPERQEWK